jgi:acyl-CoA synthetase (AMP-forming)/AMP-acid ligase II
MQIKESINVAFYLKIMAQKKPYEKAIVFPHSRDKEGNVSYTHYTFKQLDYQSDLVANGLEQYGIRKGVKTVLMVKPSLDFFSIFFAMFKSGIIPILIDPGIGIKNLKFCIEQVEPEAFIGVSKAHIARLLFSWGKKTIKKLVTVGNKFWGGVDLNYIKQLGKNNIQNYKMANVYPNETAAILFTSGSTGIPKGVVYSYFNFYAQLEQIKNTYEIKEGEIDLPTFPPFALFDPALGMTAIIPDMDPTKPANVNPKKIVEAIENFGVTNMFGSPALINKVGRYLKDNNIKLPTLKRVLSAGAPVQPKILETFSYCLSDSAEIFTPYGATESLPITSIESKEILNETQYLTFKGKGTCVGKPLKNVEVRIIKITDEPIEEFSEDLLLENFQIGEIIVKGPIVTKEYYNKPELTKLAKIKDKNNTFWHRMGDLGYFDNNGRIWFCGRKSHRVITKEKTYYTIPCEAVFNNHKAIYRTALVGVKKNNNTIPVICVELEKNIDYDKNLLIKELKEISNSFEYTKGIEIFLFHDSFPVDIRHNSKIFREKLSIWAQNKI